MLAKLAPYLLSHPLHSPRRYNRLYVFGSLAGMRCGLGEEKPSETFRCLVPLENLAGIPMQGSSIRKR